MPSARSKLYTSIPEDAQAAIAAAAPPVTPTTPAFVWSSMQEDILSWFTDGAGNLVVDALAGTSKSTTIRGGVERAPEDAILIAAFNKRIQVEMDERIDNPRVEVRTWHSIGYRTICRKLDGAWRKTAKDMGVKPWSRAESLATAVCKGAPYGAQRLVQELVTLGRELLPVDTTVEGLCDLAAAFGVLPPVDGPLTIEDVARRTLAAMDIAATVEPKATGTDFSDQIFLPLRLGLLDADYDLVVVDEYQDMTGPQLSMARAVCKPYGRIALFGDRHQAIYGFRGASAAATGGFAESLGATVLPLHRTYRCPKKVVALAVPYVPTFEAAEKAPEGVVDTLTSIAEVVTQAGPGDFILSRLNAPLAPVAMALLRAKKPAKIQGRKFGFGLSSLVRELAKGAAANSIPELLRKLTAWEERQCARLVAANRADACEDVSDKANTLRALAQDADGVPGLQARLDFLFEDDAVHATVLSTVHKAKGLEAKRVFVLRSTFFPMVACTCQHRHRAGMPCVKCGCSTYSPDPAKTQEESNLYYVAITRTMHQLTFVDTPRY